jgi:hypothetical protein
MSYNGFALLASLVLAVAAPLRAQVAEQTIDPGMTRDQVVEHLGKPLNERKTGNAWFMFYGNGCERTCGMNDLVILEDGKVVDAIFRSPSRRYSAASSSPAGVRPEPTSGSGNGESAVNRVREAGRGGLVIASPSEQPSSGAARATVTGVEVNAAPLQPAGAAPVAAPRAPVQRPVMPVPLPGATISPADSVRALTPDRPTAIPGATVNPADSARYEAIRKQLADTTRKPD